jgi:hypothetical protein
MKGSPNICLNCDSPLPDTPRFCGACGQRSDTSRLTMGDIGHDMLHALTHADHSVFALVGALVTRPGGVAREYIQGRRKRHFGPWAFLVITVGLASLVIHLVDVQWFKPFGHGRAGDLLQQHINLVILLQMPLLAAACALWFRRERLNYAEHLVLAAYTSGFRALFLALVETPLLALMGAGTARPAMSILYVALWCAYFAFAAVQFYGGARFASASKAIAAAVVSQIAIILILMGFLYLFTRITS